MDVGSFSQRLRPSRHARQRVGVGGGLLQRRYAGAPTDGSATSHPAFCTQRVLRGGSWSNEARALRSASRHREVSHMRDADFGFRLARTLGR